MLAHSVMENKNRNEKNNIFLYILFFCSKRVVFSYRFLVCLCVFSLFLLFFRRFRFFMLLVLDVFCFCALPFENTQTWTIFLCNFFSISTFLFCCRSCIHATILFDTIYIIQHCQHLCVRAEWTWSWEQFSFFIRDFSSCFLLFNRLYVWCRHLCALNVKQERKKKLFVNKYVLCFCTFVQIASSCCMPLLALLHLTNMGFCISRLILDLGKQNSHSIVLVLLLFALLLFLFQYLPFSSLCTFSIKLFTYSKY